MKVRKLLGHTVYFALSIKLFSFFSKFFWILSNVQLYDRFILKTKSITATVKKSFV